MNVAVSRVFGRMKLNSLSLLAVAACTWNSVLPVAEASPAGLPSQPAAPIMTVPCGSMGQQVALRGEPVGEGGEGVMVERGETIAEAPRLHVEASAGSDFSRFSSLSAISIGYPEGRGDARGADVLQVGRVRFHACLVALNSRRLLASTWVTGQPVTVDTRTLSAQLKQGLSSMRVSDERLLLLSETLGHDARVFTGGHAAEPVALYLVAMSPEEN
jgi:hypothetical protein